MDNLSVEYFRHKIILKLCFKKLSFRSQVQGSYKDELISNTLYATNEVIREYGIKDVIARRRGDRIFVFYLPTRRIMFEVGIDYVKDGVFCKRPNIFLVNLKGVIPNSLTIQKILDSTKLLSAYKKKGDSNGRRTI